MDKLISFCIDRPRLVNMFMLVVACMGLVSLGNARYETLPKMEMGVINVTTFKPGASPEEIELGVTLPLEDELLKVDGVSQVSSRSMENMSLITVYLNNDPDMHDATMTDLQQALDRAQSRLPKDLIEKPLINELGSDKIAIATINISGKVSETLLRDQARLIEKKIRSVSGVSGVMMSGYRRAEVAVQIKPDKQLQLGISIDEIRSAVANRNVRDSGGSVMSVVSEKKVMTVGQFSDPMDIADVIVRSRQPGNDVLISDIATVAPTFERWQEQLITNGEVSISLHIKKNREADLLKTINNIRAFVEETKLTSPAGVSISIEGDISKMTRGMISTLLNNAGMGLISVFLILWLFLGRQLALWVSIGIPFVVLGTFYFLQFTGHSINLMTMLAMILMLGMLVDDSIVTGEVIQRFRELGYAPREAAIRGTMSVSSPILVSLLTTMLAFAPLFFLSGVEGQYVAVFPVVVIIMLGTAFLQSKFILPNHLSRANLKIEPAQWVERASVIYDRVLRKLLSRRYASFGYLTLIFISIMFICLSALKFELHPETAVDTFQIQTEMPNGTPFDVNSAEIIKLQERLRAALPAEDLSSITSRIGHHDRDIYGGSEGRNQAWALTMVQMKPYNTLKMDPREAMRIVRQTVEEIRKEEVFSQISAHTVSGSPVLGKPIEVEVMSESDLRFIAAEDLKEFIGTLPGVTDVWDSRVIGKDALELEFDHAKLAAYGLSVRQVADAIRVAMDGLIMMDQQTASERIFYRLKLDRDGENHISDLKDQFIINNKGKPVALSSIATLVLKPGDSDVKHFAGRRTVSVYGEIDRKITDIKQVNAAVAKYIQEYKAKNNIPEVSFHQGGEMQQQDASVGEVGIAFATCLLLSFFVLVILFNSYSQALLVLSVIPFGIIGVFISFLVQGFPLSFLSMIGVLGLVGVLINNAVVMVHTLNTGKREINEDAIARRALTRFRPIIITSFTTLVGLVPTAYGWGGYEPAVVPMVMAMLWGVFFGTTVTLYMLPVLYYINQDIRNFLSKKIRG